MKKLFLICILFNTSTLYAKNITDTTIIEFVEKGTKSKIKVIANNSKTYEIPKVLNLDNVLKAVGVDSLQREKALIIIQKGNGGKQDTLMVLSREGNKITIVSKEKSVAAADTTIDEVEKQYNDTIQTYDEENSDDNQNNSRKNTPAKAKKYFSRSDFAIYYGLNFLTNANSSSPNNQYDLRDFKSKYVALSFRKNATLSKGKNVDVAFSYGPEIAWYNFMFKNSKVAIFNESTQQVSFIENTKKTTKSKLVVPYFNFPVMLNFGFKESKFKFGLGAYVGYRVGGYTKEVFAEKGKNKIQGDFGLNKAVYGLTTEFGRKNGITFFARYDLNKLFKTNQINGKDLQGFSAGLRL
jgi:hypothetical protein